MEDAKAQLSQRIKSANNVLVTVSHNPSVDQLAALLGLGLFLNKEGKHCAAVFSGEIPSTLEFLKPESTIQKNTDSLRDFIIALDKSKADKLRYKVEDNIVRIFITPYRAAINQDDLDFSQGDFNVDLVIALGVSHQSDLDDSIMAHGRILHDATVATINIENNGADLGAVNLIDTSASSLSELVTSLINDINTDDLDEQIATALLTGIVAMTDRFRNDRTSAKTMTISAVLMSAGANQQLVASKLEQPIQQSKEVSEALITNKIEDLPEPNSDIGMLEIDHKAEVNNLVQGSSENYDLELPEPETERSPDPEDLPAGLPSGPKLMTEPPSLGGTLTANTGPTDIEPTTDPLSLPKNEEPKILARKTNDTISSVPFKPLENLKPTLNIEPTTIDNNLPGIATPVSSGWSDNQNLDNDKQTQEEADNNLQQVHIDEEGTITQLEQAVASPHVSSNALNQARKDIDQAFTSGPDNSLPKPDLALNSQPLGPELHASDDQPPPPVPPPLPPF